MTKLYSVDKDKAIWDVADFVYCNIVLIVNILVMQGHSEN